jgi:hypothetical protein
MGFPGTTWEDYRFRFTDEEIGLANAIRVADHLPGLKLRSSMIRRLALHDSKSNGPPGHYEHGRAPAAKTPTPHKFPGTIFPTITRITSGSCCPREPSNVYDRSKPFGPAIFISHRSFAWEPIIETFQSPGRSAYTCSMAATTSDRSTGSPCDASPPKPPYQSLRHCLRVYTHRVNSWKGETR